MEYNVRMLFPSIETGTAMNAHESENYLPISRSFSASKVSRFFGPTLFRAEIYWGQLLTFITGSSSRLLRIRFAADLTMYWFPVCHFRCMKFKPLVIWIWNQNIAIFTIVGTSSHNKCIFTELNTVFKL
jgi:hypothetical protein